MLLRGFVSVLLTSPVKTKQWMLVLGDVQGLDQPVWQAGRQAGGLLDGCMGDRWPLCGLHLMLIVTRSMVVEESTMCVAKRGEVTVPPFSCSSWLPPAHSAQCWWPELFPTLDFPFIRTSKPDLDRGTRLKGGLFVQAPITGSLSIRKSSEVLATPADL